MKLSRPLCVIDVETTGTLDNIDRVVELGVVKLHPDGHEVTWRSLFDPGFPIPAEAIAVHGISDDLVKQSPRFETLGEGIWQSFNGCDVAGYNVGFDTKMLNKEFARMGLSSPFEGAKVIDAMRIFHKEEPRDLAAAYKHYKGQPLLHHHSALADAMAAKEIILAQAARNCESIDSFGWLVQASKPEVSPSAVDAEGRVVTRNGVPVLAFGKHAGTPLVKVDRGYLEWALKQDFPNDFKVLLQNTLAMR